MILCFLLSPVVAQTIRVGWYVADGYESVDEHGKPYGYYADYLRLISYYTGWQYEFAKGSWTDCLDWLERGDVDLLCAVHKTKEREETMLFSSTQCNYEICELYVPSSSGIGFEEFEKLNGLRIAVPDHSFESKALQDYAKINNFTYQEVACDSFPETKEKLKSGEADAMVTAISDNREGYSIVGQFTSDPVYFALRRDADDLRRTLDQALLNIVKFYPTLQADLYNRNISSNQQQKVMFTKEEKQFIQEHGTITMACSKRWHPFEYWNEEKQDYDGISVEVMRKIAEISGLKVNFVEDTGFSLSEFREGVEENRLTSMSHDASWAAYSKVNQTQPFISSNVLMLTKEVDRPKTVALLNSGYVYRSVITAYPELKVIFFDSTEHCVQAVANGSVDCTFVNEYEASYYLDHPQYHMIRTRRIAAFTQDICYGISDNSDPRLNSILSKSLAGIDEASRKALVGKFLINPKSPTIVVWFYDYPIVSIVICALFVLVVCVAVFMYLSRRNEHKKWVALEKANQAKTIFLSNMSHELRTPMNCIIGMTKLAEDEPSVKEDSELSEYLKKIDSSSNYLLGVLNSILDMGTIESGKFALKNEWINSADVLKPVIDMIEPIAKSKGITFSYPGVLERQAGFDMFIDPLRTRQMLMNILNNACKFTAEGGHISIKFINRKLDKKKGLACDSVIISDDGCGMSPEFQKKIFSPFEQEQNKFSGTVRGTGLGLSISRTIARSMGGDILVKSELGKGTTFEIIYPYRFRPAQNRGKDTEQAIDYDILKHKRVLVVEDHPLNEEIAKRLLEKKEMQVTLAENGQLAVDIFSASPLGTFDCILMDIRMPVMDGIMATKMIRSLDRLDAKSVPIIAMTANAYDEDVKQSLASGMNAHLAKPFEPELMYRTIAICLSKKKK